MLRPLLLVCAIAGLAPAFACSCFGPQTFCGTLYPQPPQFPDPQWWVPSDIIMAIKVNSVEYGADMKVVQIFSGTLQPEQVIRVWGDCGLLCRHYVDGLANGDTVIWALQHCDLSGNGSCGTSFEQAGDYQLSVCGIYWLGYENGVVSGPLFTEGANETVTLAEFAGLVNGCLATAVAGNGADDELIVRDGDGGPWLSLPTPARYELTVLDAAGRVRLSRSWDGMPVQVRGLNAGAFVVRVRQGERSLVRKVVLL